MRIELETINMETTSGLTCRVSAQVCDVSMMIKLRPTEPAASL